ncbi:polyprenyl synthetase family protein [Microvenator marinus]|jgi:octaprenyl-diphosphate synthase|uniref:Polyprenyl synthetase family protein n=1 Tax=Microvenator marinus TaxID=2600177 RepID=A0A5B8XP73_9DELT|nr:polyprenyl synthetase family protein [Microvenator marinus]QED27450.1 polyprenyl synthetase family protein [Microvenator marinus]
MATNPLSETLISQVEAARDLSNALNDVENLLEATSSAAGPASAIIKHVLNAGGKRIRPRLALLISGSLGGPFPVGFAAASELIHTASLLHDDVIDEGTVRRGQPTARLQWSNTESVLAGDHCLAGAVELIRQEDTAETLSESLKAVQDLVNGELLQLRLRGQLMTKTSEYEDICDLKTACLFVWTARAAARYSGADQATIAAMGEMARKVGLAFQIRDDLLDIAGDEKFGKRLLDDLRQSRMTLPVLVGIEKDTTLLPLLERVFASDEPQSDDLLEVRRKVLESGAIDDVSARIKALSEEGIALLSHLPESPYRDLIEEQIELLGQRVV